VSCSPPSRVIRPWLLAGAPRRPGRRRRRRPQAWPQLLVRHLDHRQGAAVLGGPSPLLGSPEGPAWLPLLTNF
jgi:hypothetical protein